MEYQIIEDFTPRTLASSVRKAIAEGWEPIGGVSFIQQLVNEGGGGSPLNDAGHIFCQAMIRTSVKGVACANGCPLIALDALRFVSCPHCRGQMRVTHSYSPTTGTSEPIP